MFLDVASALRTLSNSFKSMESKLKADGEAGEAETITEGEDDDGDEEVPVGGVMTLDERAKEEEEEEEDDEYEGEGSMVRGRGFFTTGRSTSNRSLEGGKRGKR